MCPIRPKDQDKARKQPTVFRRIEVDVTFWQSGAVSRIGAN